MTKEELEEDVRIGDLVEITTKRRKFIGYVDEFGENDLKIINLLRWHKKIAYDIIIECDMIITTTAVKISISVDTKSKMLAILGTDYRMGQTPVTQRLYKKVMGENPSFFQLSNEGLDADRREAVENKENTDNYPVENISWFDAVYFCNKLSMMEGLTPAYSVNGETDPECWGYTPHKGENIKTEVNRDFNSNGYRLPTQHEWQQAANGGEDYTYSGSDDLDEVGWYEKNSNNVTHPVAQKKANGYGFYDMSGNVWEWVDGDYPDFPDDRYDCGGSYCSDMNDCKVSRYYYYNAYDRCSGIGFRLVRPLD